MDPYAKESRRQLYLKKDTITYLVKANECLTWDQVTSKATGAAGSRLAWRPPKDFQVTSSGDIHSDDRGLFAKYLGHKVVFKNKINAPVRIKATVPVGKIADPTKIFSRPVVVDLTADPTGHKKDLSRKKGKKMVKNYSKATDRVEVNVTEKQLFSGDANLYSLFVQSVPGDQIKVPTYEASAFTLLDYMPILPNQNQYAGAAFEGDLIVLEIIIVVRYIVSRLVPADGSTVQTVLNFHKGSLTNLDAVFHVDADQYTTPVTGQMGAVLPGHVMIRQLDDQGYPYVGIRNKSKKMVLCNFDASKVAGPPVEFKNFENDKYVRVILPGLHVKEGGDDIIASEFGYDQGIKAWVLFVGNEPKLFSDDVGIGTDASVVSSSTPVHMFTIVRQYRPGLVQARDGLIRNYGEGLTYALSWAQIAQGLSVVLKVLPLVIQIGNLLL